ncbi:hypothetical protein C0992_011057 [Termitomyces sp. T32_za158]|nr:hypothetical protein C0992_011057 [Termitomyces sp. T32_za158]
MKAIWTMSDTMLKYRDIFVQFTGGGIGHCTTQDATHLFQKDIEKAFFMDENSSTDTDDLDTQYEEQDSTNDSEEEDLFEEEILEEDEEMSEDEDEDNEDEDNLFDEFLGYAGL